MKIALLLFGYGLGSIPTGYWIGRWFYHVDVRQKGSGNLGATNVFRVLGKKPGIITLLLDILKGVIPVYLANHFLRADHLVAVLVGAAAILGHTTSPWVGFRGGKGVATAAGVFLVLLPIPSCFSLAGFFISFYFTRIVSISSIIGAITLTVTALLFKKPPLLLGAAITVTLLILWTHRQNILRLTRGEEKPLKGPV